MSSASSSGTRAGWKRGCRWLSLALIVSGGCLASCHLAAAAVYYVSPSGDNTGPGSLIEPWRTAARAARTAEAGDTVIFTSGVYREVLAPANSGTSTAQRITFMAMPGQEVIFDGGTGRLTDWTLESGTPGVDAIYSKPHTGQIYGLFQDDFATAGRDVILWDVGTYNLYDSNPKLDLHLFDPAHDLYGRENLPKHDGFSQYKFANGVLRVRTRDARSPDEHDVRGAAQRTAIVLQNRHYIAIVGLKFRHYRNFADITGSTHILIDQCDMRFASWTGIWLNQAHGSQVRSTALEGCGSWIGHYEDGINVRNSDFVVLERNEISYCGHASVVARGSSQLWVRGNVFRDSGGHHLALSSGSDQALVEENTFARAASATTANIHKVHHAAIQFTDGSFGLFRRNLIYGGGDAISISADGGSPAAANRFEHNVIDSNAGYGILLRAYPGVPMAHLTWNDFVNNIVCHSGAAEVWLDIPTGEAQSFFFNSFRTNIIFGRQPLRLWQSLRRVSEAERGYPGVFRGNLSADPGFLDSTAGRYGLRRDSPGIDAGTDLGEPYVGFAPDIGAFEAPD